MSAKNAASESAKLPTYSIRGGRLSQFSSLKPNWIWHTALPLLAYATLVAAALTLGGHVVVSLFAAAGATMLLLFVGIHNAWDAVTYVAVDETAKKPPATQE